MVIKSSNATPLHDGWDVFLSSKFPQLDDICKLLCCSHAMAKAVHRACAGRYEVGMQCVADPTGAEVWLAHHASLLKSLWMKFAGSADAEFCLAAQLAAASGEVSGPVTRSHAAATSAAAPRRLDAIAAAAGTYSAVGPLPLRELVLEGPCFTGSIPRALQSSPQLSVLDVEFAVDISARQLAIAAQAVATMKSLEEITIIQGERVMSVSEFSDGCQYTQQ